MKKILATLLVATMLMSCMTFVSFAAAGDLYTKSSFPYAELNEAAVNAITDPVGKFYYDNYVTISGKAALTESPIGMNLQSKVMHVMMPSMMPDPGPVPEVLTINDIVLLPIYGESLERFQIDVEYDSKYLTPVYIKNNLLGDDVNQKSENKIMVMGTNGANGDFTGLFGVVPFRINSEATGNKSGEATVEIKYVIDSTNAQAQYRSVIARNSGDGQLGEVKSMSVTITGLTPGAEEDKEDTVIGQADVNAMTAAATERVTIAENSNLEDILGDKVQSLNGNTDISKATAYKAVFATINLTDKITEGVEFGFVLRDKNGVGADRFFKATAQYGGKYGVAFFGTPEVLGWYEAIPAVKVNGQLLLNTSEKEAL